MTSRPDGKREAKPVRLSRLSIGQLMNPEHANPSGDVHGGWIMKLADEAGALAAMRHAQCRVVTVAIDNMHFHEPIRVGDLVTLDAEVSYVGETSMEVRVRVTAEDPISGKRSHANTAYLVYVALDGEGRPTPVPRLITETAEEERRQKAGAGRQAYRLEQRRSEIPEATADD